MLPNVLDRLRGGAVHVGGDRHVGRQREHGGLRAERVAERGERVAIAIDDRDPRARGEELLGRGAPDAFGPAGHEDRAALKYRVAHASLTTRRTSADACRTACSADHSPTIAF